MYRPSGWYILQDQFWIVFPGVTSLWYSYRFMFACLTPVSEVNCVSIYCLWIQNGIFMLCSLSSCLDKARNNHDVLRLSPEFSSLYISLQRGQRTALRAAGRKVLRNNTKSLRCSLCSLESKWEIMICEMLPLPSGTYGFSLCCVRSR